MVIIILLNLIPNKYIDRKNKILPLSFILIAVYFAIRYNYGLDFWRYYEAFNSSREDYFGTEILFYKLLHLFPYYYQFIICYSVIVIGSLYYMVRRYVKEEFYAVFFLLFFCMNGMSFNMLSAYRTTIAACIIWWGIDLFYFRRKNIVLFILTAFIAALFHNSAIVFTVLPFLLYVIHKIDWKIAFVGLIIANFLSMVSAIDLFQWITASNDYLSEYAEHKSNIENASLFGVIHKSIWYIPAFFVLKNKKLIERSSPKPVYSLSYVYFFLFFFGLTFQERFTVYLFIFTVIALSTVYTRLSSDNRRHIVLSLLFLCIYGLYLYYGMMERHIIGKYAEGNYLFYHTIFEQPFI